MICPIQTIICCLVGIMEGSAPKDLNDHCLEEQCAWWDTYHKIEDGENVTAGRCALITIAKELARK